jgi:hypothetical protein
MTQTHASFKRIPVVRRKVEDVIRELQASVEKMERRYGCTSEEMEIAVAEGRMEDTIEVEDWSMDYQSLKSLQESAERHRTPTGSPTKRTA